MRSNITGRKACRLWQLSLFKKWFFWRGREDHRECVRAKQGTYQQGEGTTQPKCRTNFRDEDQGHRVGSSQRRFLFRLRDLSDWHSVKRSEEMGTPWF